MQTKSLTTALAAMLLISAVPMMASSNSTCSVGACTDKVAKVGGLAFAGYATYAVGRLGWNWYKKTPCPLAETNKRVAALEAGHTKLGANQELVMGNLFGTEGAAVAKHQKPTKLGMYGVLANVPDAGTEFSSAYGSALKAKEEADAKAKADKDAADAKAADEKAAKEKAAAAAAGK
jgi:hypothetical protein